MMPYGPFAQPLPESILPVADIGELLPRSLPPRWREVHRLEDGAKFIRDDGLSAIISAARELDGKRWLHVSCAFPHRLVNWRELREVKDLFIGVRRTALSILPPQERHVNIHPHCLHLWHCLDGDVTPDFTQGKFCI